MSDNTPNGDGGGAPQTIDALGIDGFMRHMDDLQESLSKVADGMEVLGASAQRQGRDVENLAAHVLAVESVLTVILRQIPVNIADVREEAERRAKHAGTGSGDGKSLVSSLAEDIVKRADD